MGGGKGINEKNYDIFYSTYFICACFISYNWGLLCFRWRLYTLKRKGNKMIWWIII